MNNSIKDVKKRTDYFAKIFKDRLLQSITSIEILNAILNRDVHFDEGFELSEEEIETIIKEIDHFNWFVNSHRGNKWVKVKKSRKSKK